MKSRILLLLLLSVLLFVLIGRDKHETRNLVLNLFTPAKNYYNNIAREIKDKGQSYLFQKERIEKLEKENRVLRKYLLDQTHYLRQVAQLYKKLPTLQKLPYKSITLVDTVSYVKLNKFDEILLSVPKKTPLKEGRIYGLIQDEVVAGIARPEGGALYGYLISNPKCRFSVYVGKKRLPGIAVGVDKNTMKVKFIPKWAEVKIGDKVETSGLDGIFFAYVPVGIVEKVEIKGSYKSAIVRTYADTMHPGLFFLITDASPYFVSYYDQNRSFTDEEYPYKIFAHAHRDENLSSVPKMLQTKDLQIDPSEFEIPLEEARPSAPAPKKSLAPRAEKKTKKATPPPANTGKSTPPGVQKPEKKKPLVPKKKSPKKDHPSPFDILRSDLF